MSAIEPWRPAEPNDLHPSIAAFAADDARRRQRWRTQRLFDLAVTASMAEPWRIARAIGIDERSLRDMREVPNIGYIARIGRLLGIEPASAAGVVGLGEPQPSPAAIDPATLREDIARADIEDDAARLDALADALAAAAREPADLALSILCGARADAARGESTAAQERAACAKSIGFSDEIAALAERLLDCIAIESTLREAWVAFDPRQAPVAAGARGDACSARGDACSARGDACSARAHVCSARAHAPAARAHAPAARAHDACSARRHSASLATGLLHAAAHDGGRVCELLAALRRHVVETAELDCPHAIAWSASVAGIAALRLREFDGVSREADRAAMSLFVAAQFAIDERIAAAAPAPAMSLLRRRLRLALHEWCDRARRGEVSQALLDEFDDSEVRTMIVRFPRARPIGLAPRVDGEIAGNIFESRR